MNETSSGKDPPCQCAICGRKLLSRLDMGRRACEVCGLPICPSCWTGRGLRQCPQHHAAAHASAPISLRAGPPAAAPASAVPPPPVIPGAPATRRCGQCGRVMPPGAGHPCTEPGCAQAVCEHCWHWLDRRACLAHALAWPERLRQAHRLLEEGRIPLLLGRESAAQREALYYRELRDRLASAPTLQFDQTRYALTGTPLAESSGQQELDAWLARVTDGTAIAGYCPRNLRLEATFLQTLRLGTRLALLFRAEILSDLASQVFPGYVTEPLGLAPLRERLADTGKNLLDLGFQLVDVVASTSGWSPEARQLATGALASELRQESGRILVLVDLETDEVIHSPAQPLPPELLDLVRPSTRLCVASELETHIRRSLTAGEFLTERELAEQFRAQPSQVRAVFQTLARTGDYQVREVPPVGWAITKRHLA